MKSNSESTEQNQKKVLNTKNYLLCVLSFLCLYIVLLDIVKLSLPKCVIHDADIFVRMTVSQQETFLKRLKEHIQKESEVEIVYFPPLKEVHTKLTDFFKNQKNVSIESIDTDMIPHHAKWIVSFEKPIYSVDLNYIPLYIESDQLKFKKVHLHHGKKLMLHIENTSKSDFSLFHNGKAVNHSFQADQEQLYMQIEPTQSQNEFVLKGKDSFIANNKIEFELGKKLNVELACEVPDHVVKELKSTWVSTDDPTLLMTENYRQWVDYSGAAWFFPTKEYMALTMKPLINHLDYHMRADSFAFTQSQHALYNWELKKQPSYYFKDPTNQTLFYCGDKVVVLNSFKYSQHLASCVNFEDVSDYSNQISLAHLFLEKTFSNQKVFLADQKKLQFDADQKKHMPMWIAALCILVSVFLFRFILK